MSNRKKIRREKITPLGHRSISTLSAIKKLVSGFSGRYNGYICTTCDKGYLTMDIDQGTTPMFSPCYATQGCKGQARSMMYPEGDPPEYLGPPIIHWYKPKPEELDKLSSEMLAHVVRGGLVRKATDAAPDWVKAIV